MLEMQRKAMVVRLRLRNPPNAVPDTGIDLKRKRGFTPVQIIDREPEQPQKIPVKTISNTDWITEVLEYNNKRKAAWGDAALPMQSPTVKLIFATVAAYYGISVIELKSQRRHMPVVRIRHVALYLAKTLTGNSYPFIGRACGDRDHTTVLNAIKQIEKARVEDSALDADIKELSNALTMQP